LSNAWFFIFINFNTVFNKEGVLYTISSDCGNTIQDFGKAADNRALSNSLKPDKLFIRFHVIVFQDDNTK